MKRLLLIACFLSSALHAALDRPKLQIINGTAQVVEVFWINENGEQIPNGTVQPGKHTIIGTTLGHRFAVVGREDKKESLVTAEVPVQAFRVGGVPSFYTQQASAGGFPVVASGKVSPYAVKEAVYIIDMMLSKRPNVREAMVKSGARLSILAHNEFTCDQPEWAWLAEEKEDGFDNLSARDFRDARARGMGGSITDPYCSCAEENLLAYDGDPYSTENILIHELAHNIHLRGMINVDATFDQRVKASYDAAMKAGLWKGKYASVNHHEYFAEGVQSWFDNNREPDHDHNHVNTRAELLDYDPGLAALCREVFGDTELKYTKPQTRLTGHLEGYDPKTAPKFTWPPHLEKARELIRAKARARSNAATKPNVLFIAVDDMRCELGCYGANHVLSPNLDKLASSGVLFTRAYCQQAVCNPSRASIMTGLRPDFTKVWDLVTDFRSQIPDAVTIPQHFRANGYRAVAFGKIFHNTFPDDISWDEPTDNVKSVIAYSPENQQRLKDFKAKMESDGKPRPAIERMRGPATEAQEQPDEMNFDGKQTTEALGKMRELAAGKSPFFLAVGFIRPHLPFITPKKYWDLYDRAKLPLAKNPFLPHGAPAVAFGEKSMGGFYELRDYMDYSDAPSPFERPLTDAQQRELKHGYYASVSFIDAQVGRLLAGLDDLGLAQNTIVVLWSDHGWKLGEHNGWCKQTNYEIDTRAPLMIRAPNAKANGQKCDSLVEFVDIYPTLCDLAGLPMAKNLAGRSLAPLLADASAKVKDAAFSQFPRKHDGRDHMGYAMRTERYRYVEWLDAQTGEIVSRELYDHTADADENENLAEHSEHAALLEKLSAELWQHLPRPTFPHPALQAAASTTSSRVTRNLSGWTLHISPKIDAAAWNKALPLLQAQLEEIIRVVPDQAVAELRKVPLWFNPQYPNSRPGAEYHPDAGWLKDNGRDPAMAKGVEFSNVRVFEAETRRMPNFALHELAHAYHDRVLGFDRADIIAAFNKAKAAGKYDKVQRQDSEGRKRLDRAYAMTNHKEYFAECTEAFFSKNDFFPFTREELKAHDPDMFELLKAVWDRPNHP